MWLVPAMGCEGTWQVSLPAYNSEKLMHKCSVSLFLCYIKQWAFVETCKCGTTTRWSRCQPGSLADNVQMAKMTRILPLPNWRSCKWLCSCSHQDRGLCLHPLNLDWACHLLWLIACSEYNMWVLRVGLYRPCILPHSFLETWDMPGLACWRMTP